MSEFSIAIPAHDRGENGPKWMAELLDTLEEQTCQDFEVVVSDQSKTDNITDMCLMSMCDYQIMANSTYSWWGAWLSNSKDVIAPKLWFGPDGQDPKDVYVDRWEYLEV